MPMSKEKEELLKKYGHPRVRISKKLYDRMNKPKVEMKMGSWEHFITRLFSHWERSGCP